MSNINDEMKATANYAMKSEKEKFGQELDFSEQSIDKLDNLLNQAYQSFFNLPKDEKTSNAISRAANIWGSYLGEFMHQKWGGDWILKGSERLISIKNTDFSPIKFVYQKITSNPEYSVRKYILEAESQINPSIAEPQQSQNLTENKPSWIEEEKASIETEKKTKEEKSEINPEVTIINEDIDQKIKKNKLTPKNKIIIFLTTALGILIIGIISFFVFTYVQQQARINMFNSDLQNVLSSDLTDKNNSNIKVSGNYASLITLTENFDKWAEIRNASTTEELKSLTDKLIYSSYVYDCLGYRIKRSELFVTYATSKVEYQKDKKFQQFNDINPLCRVITPIDTYEFVKNEWGVDVFTVNGVPTDYSLPDTLP